ncbi:hypothetical protein [Paenibacillus polymyxa]|uniref:hypothetical protein n=1 Tax=Paenibacillus polymyxa TaxID=1406 RepID=UPI0006C2457B|nr:hypothetical protein [Paenibacillus polymyxa]KOS04152.1 hypothetical protein AM598_02545 [Paenibacillus polymyxa]
MFNSAVLESVSDINLLTDMLRAEFSLEDWDAMVHIADKLYLSIRTLQKGNQKLIPKNLNEVSPSILDMQW